MEKKFRFPKKICQVNFPSRPPFGFDELAKNEIGKTLGKFSSLPKNARVRFEYKYPSGICEVQIYKWS